MQLEEGKEEEYPKVLWHRIYNYDGNLIIILDDVWEELNLRDIGIPSWLDHGNCYILITTRDSKVCQAMRCQQTIQLHTLTNKDALNLFLLHARSGDDLEVLAQDFVKECGGLPITIVSLASTLRNWPISEWKVALATLHNSVQFLDIDENLVKVYKCLSLSYENLRNEKAQKLFLLCSIFPEDFL